MKPDFSKDPERVALAKVLREMDWRGNSSLLKSSLLKWEDWPDCFQKRGYLAMAEAAITHLGAGYRLPEATEANAERLGRIYPQFCEMQAPEGISFMGGFAYRWLAAVNAAFGEAEKPEPATVAKHATAPDPDRCSDGCICERCGFPLAASVSEGCVQGNCSMRPLPPLPEPPQRTEVDREAQEEREELARQFMVALVGARFDHFDWRQYSIDRCGFAGTAFELADDFIKMRAEARKKENARWKR